MPASPVPHAPLSPLLPLWARVNQLSAAINPFPLQKLDLFIKPLLTLHPPPSKVYGPKSKVGMWLVRGDPLHRRGSLQGKFGKFGRKVSSSYIKSHVLLPLRGGEEWPASVIAEKDPSGSYLINKVKSIF